MTDPRYTLDDTSEIITPAMIVFRELLEENLNKMIATAGDPARLRPHCKTHKTRQIVEMQIALGILKHKAATFAEAEMLAGAGAKDIFLAYNIVGANIGRAVRFVQAYPDVLFSVTADHADPIRQLGAAMSAAGVTIDVLLDVDTGQHRTGIVVGDEATELYRLIGTTDGLLPGGFHVYDGHQHQKSLDDRRAAIHAEWEKVIAFRDALVAEGLPVPRIVAGGTGSFPVYAEMDDPTIELSPGTCVYHDGNYSDAFPDLDYTPAAGLLTRVVSRPTSNRVTFDLGYKAVASDPPPATRATFPTIPDAKLVLQNEEHLVVETEHANEFTPGDEVLAMPWHVCPTSAMHKEVFVAQGGKIVDRWAIAARDRQLEI